MILDEDLNQMNDYGNEDLLLNDDMNDAYGNEVAGDDY